MPAAGVVEPARLMAAKNQDATPLAMASTVNKASRRRFKVLVSISLSGSDKAHCCLLSFLTRCRAATVTGEGTARNTNMLCRNESVGKTRKA